MICTWLSARAAHAAEDLTSWDHEDRCDGSFSPTPWTVQTDPTIVRVEVNVALNSALRVPGELLSLGRSKKAAEQAAASAAFNLLTDGD